MPCTCSGSIGPVKLGQAAAIDAGLLLIEQAAAEGRLGAVVEEHPAFFVAEICLEASAFFSVGRGEVETGGGEGHGANLVNAP
jgi:hypothetical protein